MNYTEITKEYVKKALSLGASDAEVYLETGVTGYGEIVFSTYV